MARHSFVTDVSFGLRGFQLDRKPVEVLSRADVRKIVLEVIEEEVWGKLKSQERKITKVGERAETAVKDAKVAREEIQRFVETARETFRDVIEEILVPHYRFLAQHLGIEVPDQLTSVASKNRTASTRETARVALPSNGSVSAKPKKKTTRRIIRAADEDRKAVPAHPKKKTTSAAKTLAASKKKTALTRSARKGVKPCR